MCRLSINLPKSSYNQGDYISLTTEVNITHSGWCPDMNRPAINLLDSSYKVIDKFWRHPLSLESWYENYWIIED